MASLIKDLHSLRVKAPEASVEKFELTDQMQALVEAPLGVKLTRVIGYAGATKTSTLIARSRRLPQNLNLLYVAFTKSAQQDAQARFGVGNTSCRTANSLAFAAVGKRYAHKLREPRLMDIQKAINRQNNWILARMVQDTIRAWCSSADFDFPKTAVSLQGNLSGSAEYQEYAAQLAKMVWDRMVDPKDDMPMSHEGYLKVFQLSKPSLPFDAIMLDEAQDTNPVTWDILQRQDCPLEIIGDPYQSIFLFRGAINAMANVNPDREFLLSKSFRFGPKIANVANTILFNFFGETRPLEGLGPDSKIGPIEFDQPHAVISRTNATLFDHAVAAVMSNKSLGFAGGVNAYAFEKLIDVMHLGLRDRHLIRDHYLKGFSSFAEYEMYAEDANDLEAKRHVSLFKNHGSNIEALVNAIHRSSVVDLSKANLVLSTAHRSKGLSLDRVQLANDFPCLLDEDGHKIQPPDLDLQEANLLYVAATRARLEMSLNKETMDFMAAYPI